MTLKALLVLLVSGAMVTACASTSEKNIERKHSNSEWEKNLGYTQAVRVGNTLYLSGVGGKGETLVAQLQDIYQTIDKLLADYNATSGDIVKEVIYTTDIEQLIKAIPARKEYFKSGKYPSATWVEVARLYSPEMQVEIEVVVQIPEK